ncbi:FAD dependent oxidoreductase [Xylariales sp. PMI_506]|nr:FAD dependent oxidoreductase [Xylariales sp. PMI_506]
MSATVILGSGIIGASTAFYLLKHQPGSAIHLVEASPELFASASGFAGGFLAKSWFSPEVAELGALSFEEHRKLAEKEDGATRWGYAPSTSITLSPSSSGGSVDIWFRNGASRADAARGRREGATADAAPPWLWTAADDDVEIISEAETVAQLDPLQLSQFLLQKCLDAGVHLHHPAKATLVQTDVRDEISSIRILNTESGTETDVPCTNIIIAAGAWTPQVFGTLFPKSGLRVPVSSLSGHSLVVRSPRWAKEHEQQHGCHSIFMTSQPGYSPEIFSRIGGDLYIGGLNSATEPLPTLANESKANISSSSIATLRQTARRYLGLGETDADDLEVVREGLCFRPVTDTGIPIVSRVPEGSLGEKVGARPAPEGGVYIAAGHGPWGISMSLGTGKVMAEMVQGRALSANIDGLRLNT